MRLIAGVLIAVLFVALFRVPIKKAPIVFYLLAVAGTGFYLYGVIEGLPAWMWKSFMFLFQKNIFAFGLFCVVMFIGVLKEGSALRKALMPIRGELSIIACLLSAGHMVVFGQTYLLQINAFIGASSLMYLVASFVALVAAALMVPLFVTSIRKIRASMNQTSWKRVQLLAYPFFILVFVHILFFIGPSALERGGSQLINVLCYTALFAAYGVLRIRKYAGDRKASKLSQSQQ